MYSKPTGGMPAGVTSGQMTWGVSVALNLIPGLKT
jgi:hypothetical protein